MLGLFKTFAHGRQLCGSKQFTCPDDVPKTKVIVYEWLCRFVSVMHRTDASDTPWRIYLLLTMLQHGIYASVESLRCSIVTVGNAKGIGVATRADSGFNF